MSDLSFFTHIIERALDSNEPDYILVIATHKWSCQPDKSVSAFMKIWEGLYDATLVPWKVPKKDPSLFEGRDYLGRRHAVEADENFIFSKDLLDDVQSLLGSIIHSPIEQALSSSSSTKNNFIDSDTSDSDDSKDSSSDSDGDIASMEFFMKKLLKIQGPRETNMIVHDFPKSSDTIGVEMPPSSSSEIEQESINSKEFQFSYEDFYKSHSRNDQLDSGDDIIGEVITSLDEPVDSDVLDRLYASRTPSPFTNDFESGSPPSRPPSPPLNDLNGTPSSPPRPFSPGVNDIEEMPSPPPREPSPSPPVVNDIEEVSSLPPRPLSPVVNDLEEMPSSPPRAPSPLPLVNDLEEMPSSPPRAPSPLPPVNDIEEVSSLPSSSSSSPPRAPSPLSLVNDLEETPSSPPRAPSPLPLANDLEEVSSLPSSSSSPPRTSSPSPEEFNEQPVKTVEEDNPTTAPMTNDESTESTISSKYDIDEQHSSPSTPSSSSVSSSSVEEIVDPSQITIGDDFDWSSLW